MTTQPLARGGGTGGSIGPRRGCTRRRGGRGWAGGAAGLAMVVAAGVACPVVLAGAGATQPGGGGEITYTDTPPPPRDYFAQPQFEPSRDYAGEIVALSKRAQNITAEEHDGWRGLLEAIERMIEAHEEVAGVALRSPAGTLQPQLGPEDRSVDLARVLLVRTPGPREVELADRVVTRMGEKGVWTILDGLAEKRGAVRPRIEGMIIRAPLSELNNARWLARGLWWSMRRAAERGEAGEFLAQARRAATLGRLFIGQAGPREHSTGVFILNTTLVEIMVAAQGLGLSDEARRAFDRDVLEGLARVVESMPTADPGPALRANALLAMDAVERCFPRQPTAEQASGAIASRALAELFRRLEAVAEQPARRREAEMSALLRWVGALPPQLIAVNHFGPEAAQMILSRDHYNVRREGARVVLGIERYRRQHGSLPRDLSELGPFLPTIPADPFAEPGVGMRFIVRGDATGGRQGSPEPEYLVYSVGVDGQDQGGVYNPEIPEAALAGESGAGLDYPVNLPPKRLEVDQLPRPAAATPAAPEAPAGEPEPSAAPTP
jgi:hypothetical protein